MNQSTPLQGILYLGFLDSKNSQDIQEQIYNVEDLISNYEELDLENLRELFPEIHFSGERNEIPLNCSIHEIQVSDDVI